MILDNLGLDQNYEGHSTKCIVEACEAFLEKTDPNGNCEVEEHVLFNICCPDNNRKKWITRFTKAEKAGVFSRIEEFVHCYWSVPVVTNESVIPVVTKQSVSTTKIIVTTISSEDEDTDNDGDDGASETQEELPFQGDDDENKNSKLTSPCNCSKQMEKNVTLIQLIAVMKPIPEPFPFIEFLMQGGFVLFEIASVAHFAAGFYFTAKFWKHVK